MSTTTTTIPDSKVTLELPEGEDKDAILNFRPFKEWFARTQHNLSLQSSDSNHEFHTDPYTLSHIEIEHVDHWGTNIGFIKLTSKVQNTGKLNNDKPEDLPGSMLLRGPSVGMLVILQPDDLKVDSEAERYVPLTTQARIAAGGLRFLELPAGMVDGDDKFAGTAAKEIKEELGIEIDVKHLINMSEKAIDEGGKEDLPRGMFPSAGGCDEFIQLFLYEKRIPRKELEKWNGRLTGLRGEGEKITLKLVKLEDLWKEGARDAKALAALSLYENLRKTNKLYKK